MTYRETYNNCSSLRRHGDHHRVRRALHIPFENNRIALYSRHRQEFGSPVGCGWAGLGYASYGIIYRPYLTAFCPITKKSVVRRRPSQSEAVVYFGNLKNGLTQNQQICHLLHIAPDMSSISSYGRQLSRKGGRKRRLRHFRWRNISRMVCAMTNKFHRLIEDDRPHKPAGHDVASCFPSAAKCN